uniref:Uncharacterized protein n=1 Tax=Knipowitschia caucasica TaxID=637954 RepID=A0AAV2L3S4_KNICA
MEHSEEWEGRLVTLKGTIGGSLALALPAALGQDPVEETGRPLCVWSCDGALAVRLAPVQGPSSCSAAPPEGLLNVSTGDKEEITNTKPVYSS